MTNQLPVICIITSASCGFCNKMRGTGDLIKGNCVPSIPGGHCWNSAFFKRLLFGGKELTDIKNTDVPEVRIFEIHFGPLAFAPEEMYLKINEFNEFVWNGTDVQRNKYKAEFAKPGDNMDFRRVTSVINGRTTISDKLFVDFLALNIPKDIYIYIKHYPLWLFCRGDIWNAAISEGGPLIAHVAGFNTILKGTYGNKQIYDLEPENLSKIESIILIERRFLAGDIPASTSKPPKEDTTKNSVITVKTGCQNLGYVIKSVN